MEQSGTGAKRRPGLCGDGWWEAESQVRLSVAETTPTSTHTGREQVREKEGGGNRTRKQDTTKLTEEASSYSSNNNKINQVEDKGLDRCN